LQNPAQLSEVKTAMEQRFHDDTSVQFSYLPTLRGLEALQRDEPAKAVEMTQLASPYDFAVPRIAGFTNALFGALYPIYVRGLAYSKLSRHREAAFELQKILDHPGVVLNDPVGSMARLQLARVLSASGSSELRPLIPGAPHDLEGCRSWHSGCRRS
jgi:hypothetical protein